MKICRHIQTCWNDSLQMQNWENKHNLGNVFFYYTGINYIFTGKLIYTSVDKNNLYYYQFSTNSCKIAYWGGNQSQRPDSLSPECQLDNQGKQDLLF